MAQQKLVKEEKSLGDLFSDLAANTGTLMRQEIALAQVELTQKATAIGTNVGFLAVGGAVAYAGVLAIIAGLIILLGQAIPLWLSAVIIGVVLAAAAFFLISSALGKLKKTDPLPRDTIESIKEDAEWLKNEMT